MKYEFIKVDEDTTELKYKDKVVSIKRDIDLQVKVQGATARGRMLMSKELTKEGMTRKDLTIEKHEGNKTYYDNSNANDLEEYYQMLAVQEVFDELVKKYANMSLTDLMQDVGLDIINDNKENQDFIIALTSAFMGNKSTPSQK